MGLLRRIRSEGVSMRVIHFFMILLVGTISAMLIFATFHILTTYQGLSDATDEYISLEKDAYALMQASDYLTECAQRFTLAGELEYVEAYFDEVFHTRRRELAMEDMQASKSGQAALVKLSGALEKSNALMEREYYAMKMVVAALGYEDYPAPLKEVELKTSESMLSKANKLTMARNLVLGKAYYRDKESIRSDMRDCLALLEDTTHTIQAQSSEELNSELSLARVVILWQAVAILLMILLTTWLSIHPLLKAVDSIKADEPLPVIGANEFRYLARTYNHMYEVYKKSVERLNFKASHDELTQVYNRAGYELLISNIDLPTTVLLILDLDNFKDINDRYGHETGDRALQYMAETVRHSFRSDDYVCRIGGDEFVVLMSHSEVMRKGLIRDKIERINHALANPGAGLPPMSVSVGVAHGAYAQNAAQLFEMADQALYQTKRHGRHGCTFYTA